ncbi:helix-turn-helix domain-containing protein [Variovorax rhizosphaerae]|uniref:Helix-turn-helix domain-containing protein n=1 Tax=Variovorax rhizosphaerae TaxID=1836200 RepID=A0ABU8WJA1_9BURK
MDDDPDDQADTHLASVAAAIAEPARARMLCSLMDGHARTATELATVGGVAASTASSHLARLREQKLIESVAQGKHRYFRLAGSDVAAALEGLLVVAGARRDTFRPNTPTRLRAARTCYDHIAGSAGVALHDQLLAQGWIEAAAQGSDYELTANGALALESLGLDIDAARQARRRFACACLDWSERRPHLGGALAAAWLQLSLRRGWVRQALDERELTVTGKAHREMPELFGD